MVWFSTFVTLYGRVWCGMLRYGIVSIVSTVVTYLTRELSREGKEETRRLLLQVILILNLFTDYAARLLS